MALEAMTDKHATRNFATRPVVWPYQMSTFRDLTVYNFGTSGLLKRDPTRPSIVTPPTQRTSETPELHLRTSP